MSGSVHESIRDEDSCRKEPEELVDAVDRERADFIQKYFSAEWPDRVVYDTMLNTMIGDECVVSMILGLVQTYDARCTA